MDRLQRATLILVLALAAVLFWQYRRSQPAGMPKRSQEEAQPMPASNPLPVPPPSTNPLSSPGSEPAPLVSSSGTANPSSPQPAALTPELPPLSAELASLPPRTVLENLRTSVRQYGAMFGGNPVGTNPEITKALQGDNPKHINFLKADGNRVNGNGELVDVWGTPYFFHQLSGTEMEIHSAGPDRKMWTQDDLVIK